MARRRWWKSSPASHQPRPTWRQRRRAARDWERRATTATDSLWLYTKFLRGDFTLGFDPTKARPRVVTARELAALLISQGERGWSDRRITAALEHGVRDGWVRRVATTDGRPGYAIVPERFR